MPAKHRFSKARARSILRPRPHAVNARVREEERFRDTVGGALVAPIAALMNTRMLVEDALTPARVRASNACVSLTLSRPVDHG